MDQELPQTMGYEAAGIVDEVGEESRTSLSVTACSGSPPTVPHRQNWRCCPIDFAGAQQYGCALAGVTRAARSTRWLRSET